MKFMSGIPGLTRYGPISSPWEATMRAEDFQHAARAIEDFGYDAITAPEHIVMPVEMVDLMGGFWPHAFTAMAFAAGATSRVIVDSSVIVLPYHNPVVFAKAVSTLDLLTGGRVRLSLGVGHAEREFEAIGVPYHERGRVADEYLAAMIELWTSAEPTFHGKYVDFEGIVSEPRPTQQPHPPIWIGGNSRAAMDRAARHDGWFPWLVTAEQLPERLDYIRARPGFEARTRPFDLAVSVSVPRVNELHEPLDGGVGRPAALADTQQVIDAVGHLEEIGVTWTSLPRPRTRSLDEHLDYLQWGAEEILPVFH